MRSNLDALESTAVEERLNRQRRDVVFQRHAVRRVATGGACGRLQGRPEEAGVGRRVEEELLVGQHETHRPRDDLGARERLVPAETGTAVPGPAAARDRLDRLYRNRAFSADLEQPL